MTQRERVIARLNDVGSVDNFWAIQHYILRLGAIIHELREEGWEIEGSFGKALGYPSGQWKNFYYSVTKKPDEK